MLTHLEGMPSEISVAQARLADFFACKPYVCVSRGRPSVKRGFFGMPRLRPDDEKCMFFALGEDGRRVGTGFFVTRVTVGGAAHIYGMTNHHVAQTGGGRVIAINTKAAGRRLIETEDRDWVWDVDADIAAIDLSDHIVTEDDVAAVSENEFINNHFLSRAEIGIGDEIFLVGLFAPHAGIDRIIPSARFGSLSILADEVAPVPAYRYGGVVYPPRPRFVADMRSRAGYSGSPVFVYRTIFVDLRNFKGETYVVDTGEIGSDQPDTFVRLLGMHCSQFVDRVTVDDNSPELSGRSLDVPGAMAVIIPAWEISALLDRPELEERRNMRDTKKIMTETIRAEAVEPPAPGDNPTNPMHREDFKRLVGAAAKKHQPSDRT